MFERYAILFAAALALAAAGGCASDGAKPEAEPKSESATKSEVAKIVPDPCVSAEIEDAARAAAEKLANGMASSLKSGDFAAFEAVQPKGGRVMTPALFARMRSSLGRLYGKPIGIEYFGRLRQGRVNDYLWKFAFEAPSPNGEPPVRREVIYWVRVGSSGGKPVVAGYSFDLH